MLAATDRKKLRTRVRRRIRLKVRGDSHRPRLAVFRSGKHMYVQAIDDASGRTLAQASTQEKGVRGDGKGWDIDSAKRVGETIAGRLKEAGVEACVFDRGGFLYHGRVKALADAAREAGLKL